MNIDAPLANFDNANPGCFPSIADAQPFAYEDRPAPNPELWLYRERTIALLRRYLRISIEVGRLHRFWAENCFDRR